MNNMSSYNVTWVDLSADIEDIIAGSILSVESLGGIALYLLVIYVLIKHKFHKEHPSYILMISMGVAEVWLLLFFFFMGLMMITQNHFVPETAIYIQTFFVNIPWTVDLAHINLLAFQRFAAIFGATKYPSLRVVFGEKFCKLAVLGAWFIGSAYFVLSYLVLPGWVTEVVDYNDWLLTPLYAEYKDQREIYWLCFNFTFIILSVLISLPTAIRVIIQIRKTRPAVQRSSSVAPGMRTLAKEKILVYMTAIHTSVLLVNNVVMNVLSIKANINWIRLILMCIFILDFFISPLIYLSINTALRKLVKETFGWKDRSDAVNDDRMESTRTTNVNELATVKVAPLPKDVKF